MSYEKIRITRITPQKDRETGEERLYVEFEQLISARLRLDKALHLRPEFEALLGQEALVPMRAGVFEGRPFWSLDADGRPIPFQASSSSLSSGPASVMPSMVKSPVSAVGK